MIEVLMRPHAYENGRFAECETSETAGRARTIAANILAAHDCAASEDILRIRFDALASHDITYVGIIQAARASGMRAFPLPYVLTNCHNSLCAVGGTINEDDHAFGLSAARKYGGVNVPAHQAVIHQYMREMMAGCGAMILGSDSHTRYGALGCLGVGEGGPELVKQLLGQTWDLAWPSVVAVELVGSPAPGVGPQDVALALVAATFERGLVKNKVLEFVGPGLDNLSVEYRLGIDVMTTETACLSSVWRTDEAVREYLALHGREEAYRALAPSEGATYDGLIRVDLGKVRPMIALPFHPSNALPIEDFLADPLPHLRRADELAAEMLKKGALPRLSDKLRADGFHVDQGVIAGCSGGLFENLTEAADILRGRSIGAGTFALSIYPASQPQMSALMKDGALADLMTAGATIRSAFCGPCFGAGDVPANGGLSIRHSTRNFPSREGARPADGQLAYVALMDARSIAATARNEGRLTPATDIAWTARPHLYAFDAAIYQNRVYDGRGKPKPEESLVFGPNIADWPRMIAMPDSLLLTVAASITDPVTTTDELIPSGETSSYRSNPVRLAEFTLSRKDPLYVGRAKRAQALEMARRQGEDSEELRALYEAAGLDPQAARETTGVGSLVFALKPGDGSAREQAASCQRVLGGCANVAGEYATKRYRSNVVNWGMLPFILDEAAEDGLRIGDLIHLPSIRAELESGAEAVRAIRVRGNERAELTLRLPNLTRDERDVLLAGCLMNYYKERLA